MGSTTRPLAVVTGASSGIGYELARCCAVNGFDLVIAADVAKINAAAADLRALGCNVDAVQVDLSTIDGVDKLYSAIAGRPVAALFANAGRGLGNGFLDQDFVTVRQVIDTNITGTLYLVQKIGRDMRAARAGRILITGSIAGNTPGMYHAVYHASKAFLDSFSTALRAELQDTGITVTLLMPGATKTDFFERADLEHTKLGHGKMDGPAAVAQEGFDATMKGVSRVVTGWHNKFLVAMANVIPASVRAQMFGKQAKPHSAHQ
jgi:short-subunit dehydrogenase